MAGSFSRIEQRCLTHCSGGQ